MKKLIVFLACFFLTGILSNANAVSYFYNGSEYQVTSSSKNWAGAESEAESWGGYLVTINDASEQNWLTTTFGLRTYYWIGYTDQDEEGTWEWISGSTATYTYWNSGEPNQAGNEDYAVLNWDQSTGEWNDWSGANCILGIMERSANNAVPEPTTMLLFGTGIAGLAAFGRRKTD
nr:lectin-like protein [uncultured Desulfobulbus sp.]